MYEAHLNSQPTIFAFVSNRNNTLSLQVTQSSRYLFKNITFIMASTRHSSDESNDADILSTLTPQQRARLQQVLSVINQDVRVGLNLLQQCD